MKQFLPYIAAVAIAGASFAAGTVSDLGTAFGIATNKEQAKEYCIKLLDANEVSSETSAE